jgi:hypothetical protein
MVSHIVQGQLPQKVGQQVGQLSRGVGPLSPKWGRTDDRALTDIAIRNAKPKTRSCKIYELRCLLAGYVDLSGKPESKG